MMGAGSRTLPHGVGRSNGPDCGDLTYRSRPARCGPLAVVQVHERLRDYEAGLFPNLPYLATRRCYPAVVTLEEWHLLGERITAFLDLAVADRMNVKGLDL